jgi:2-phospho-L-lactate/phosphoenolpyruvate guanylyltransferase
VTAALVPVKPLALSKSRLRTVLSDDQRRALTLAMMRDVIAAARSAELWPVSVISPDPSVLSEAGAAGARAQAEAAGSRGLNAAVTRGLQALADHGEQAALVILADVPMVSAEDLHRAASELAHHGVVVARATDGGTPLLGLRLPPAIELCYGRHSALRHVKSAAQREVDALLLSLPSLQWDLDSAEDVERYRREGPRTQTRLLVESFDPVPVA